MEELGLIIFDMDGLMFDTERLAFNSWRQAGLKYGYLVEEETFKKTIGVNVRRTKEIFLEHFGVGFPVEQICNERYDIAENIIENSGVPVKDGLYELLSYLNGLKIKKAVATSTSRERALNLLKKAKIDMYFDYIMCGDEVENSKPHPEIFLKVAEKLGCAPERCLVLEDSEAGVQAAYRAGMMPVMVPDMIEPGEEVKRIIHKKMACLHEVKLFLEETVKQWKEDTSCIA